MCGGGGEEGGRGERTGSPLIAAQMCSARQACRGRGRPGRRPPGGEPRPRPHHCCSGACGSRWRCRRGARAPRAPCRQSLQLSTQAVGAGPFDGRLLAAQGSLPFLPPFEGPKVDLAER